MAIGFRLFGQNMFRVQKQELGEIARRRSGVDGTAEAFFNKLRNTADMVHMGVSYEQGFDLFRIVCKRPEILFFGVAAALRQAAVDENLFSGSRLQKIICSGYFAGTAAKCQAHMRLLYTNATQNTEFYTSSITLTPP